jgi:hypothetical protein
MNDKLKSMFDDIQDSLNKNDNSGSYKEMLKMEKGHTYTVRLIPNFANGKKTFFQYKYYAFNSFLTGKYIHWVSPVTFGDPCPVQQESFRIGRECGEAEKERGKALWSKNAWLVNVYVVDDPTNPDNNGKVKIIKLGKQLKEIIDSALTGDDKEEFGLRIFDLSPDGCNFKIKVTENEGKFPSYTMSRFTSPSELYGVGKDKNKIEEVYSNIHDLETIYPVKTYQELKSELKKHYYQEVDTKSDNSSTNVGTVKGEKLEIEDDLPFDTPTVNKPSNGNNIDDVDLDDLLSGLDD